MEKVQRLISWYDKSTEKCVGEKNIDNIEVEKLRMIFSPPLDDPFMIHPFEITKGEAEQLQQIIEVHFLFEKYDYYLECFKADT